MLEEVFQEVMNITEKLIEQSTNPFYQRFGKHSIIIYLSNYKDFFNPLIVFSGVEEESNIKITMWIKKDTNNISLDRPYRKNDFDTQIEILYSRYDIVQKIRENVLRELDFLA